ncbi:hypothetical protein TREES_T100007102 [Tupaia chinensis]|uniref:Uncharacterized protein n=1 Tax=Tupaia chinensis TaxID=246437 RepID=L9L484_TUPCH|nr:hypothetical protein TREES_T100007102 [Tupaia chinensis]
MDRRHGQRAGRPLKTDPPTNGAVSQERPKGTNRAPYPPALSPYPGKPGMVPPICRVALRNREPRTRSAVPRRKRLRNAGLVFTSAGSLEDE